MYSSLLPLQFNTSAYIEEACVSSSSRVFKSWTEEILSQSVEIGWISLVLSVLLVPTHYIYPVEATWVVILQESQQSDGAYLSCSLVGKSTTRSDGREADRPHPTSSRVCEARDVGLFQPQEWRLCMTDQNRIYNTLLTWWIPFIRFSSGIVSHSQRLQLFGWFQNVICSLWFCVVSDFEKR